jgi:hypothetical protein
VTLVAKHKAGPPASACARDTDLDAWTELLTASEDRTARVSLIERLLPMRGNAVNAKSPAVV